MRIIVFSITAVLLLGMAVVGLIVLLVGLNGYSERHATPGLIVYLAICLATVPGMGAVGSAKARSLVESKALGKVRASAGVIIGVGISGVMILMVGVVVAFVMAEVLRAMR